MTSLYADDASEVLDAIAEAGGDVVFPDALLGTPGVYDGLTGLWSGASSPSDVTGKAVQGENDLRKFAALNLIATSAVTLLIAAKDLAIAPAPGMLFVWAGTTYAVKDAEALNIDSQGAILYTVIGGA